MAGPGRNDRCPCGSGRKFKHCCEAKKKDAISSRMIVVGILGAILVVVLAALSNSGNASSGRVWSAEHGHYHDASGREVPR
jgi:hypothetical protein